MRWIFWFLVSKLSVKKAIANVAIPLAGGNLPGLVSNLTSSAINKSDRKIIAKEHARARKGFTFFTSNEDINDIIKVKKSLEDSGILLDGVTKAVKYEIKKRRIYWSFVSTFSCFINTTSKFLSSKRYKW